MINTALMHLITQELMEVVEDTISVVLIFQTYLKICLEEETSLHLAGETYLVEALEQTDHRMVVTYFTA